MVKNNQESRLGDYLNFWSLTIKHQNIESQTKFKLQMGTVVAVYSAFFSNSSRFPIFFLFTLLTIFQQYFKKNVWYIIVSQIYCTITQYRSPLLSLSPAPAHTKVPTSGIRPYCAKEPGRPCPWGSARHWWTPVGGSGHLLGVVDTGQGQWTLVGGSGHWLGVVDTGQVIGHWLGYWTLVGGIGHWLGIVDTGWGQ